jgi:exonuclease III
MPPLKLATFNINNIVKLLAVLLEWLTKASPDIVCLQELKVPDTRLPLREIEAVGYGDRWMELMGRALTEVAFPAEVERPLRGFWERKVSALRVLAGQGQC